MNLKFPDRTNRNRGAFNTVLFKIILMILIVVFTGTLYAQNLTTKREYFPFPNNHKIRLEYQILPNGTYHGYYKQFNLDGICLSHKTYNNGHVLKIIEYFLDGKTTFVEINQDQSMETHGIQKMNLFKNGVVYLKHTSNWSHGRLISAKTYHEPNVISVSIENNHIIRNKFSTTDKKSIESDNFILNADNSITGFISEETCKLDFKNGLLMKAVLNTDPSRVLFLRESPDTLTRIYKINEKDSTQEYGYLYDTIKTKIYFSSIYLGYGAYREFSGSIKMLPIGIRYDDDELVFTTLFDNYNTRASEKSDKSIIYKYMNFNGPDNKKLTDDTGRKWKLFENVHNSYEKLYSRNGAIISYKKYSSNGDWLTYDKDGKIINSSLMEKGKQSADKKNLELFDKANAIANTAYNSFSNGAYDECITECGEALKINPNLAYMHWKCGLAYLIQNKEELASKFFSQAISVLSESNPRTIGGVTGLISRNGFFQDAVSSLQHITEYRNSNVNQPTINKWVEWIKVQEQGNGQGQGQGMSEDEQIKRINALSYAKSKDYGKSREIYFKLLELGKAVPDDYYNLGKVCYSMKDYKTADSILSIYNQQQPTLINGFVWRARSLAMLDPDSKSGKAVSTYEIILEKTNSDPVKYKKEQIEALYYLTYYNYIVFKETKNQGNRLKAIEYSERLQTIEPTDENAIKAKEIMGILKTDIQK